MTLAKIILAGLIGAAIPILFAWSMRPKRKMEVDEETTDSRGEPGAKGLTPFLKGCLSVRK